MNNLAISTKKFFTNKNTVTIIGVIAVLVILYFLYTKTINEATDEVQVPVATQTIPPQTQINDSDVGFVKVANAAKPDNVLMDANSQIIGKYTAVGSTIYEGSMFYSEAVVNKEDLPGNWLTLVDTATEKPYYYAVNTETTFGNSIQPNDYVDFYVRAKNEKGQLMFGKMLSNVKVLAVTDSEGRDVFRSSTEVAAPAFLNFGLAEDNYNVLKKAEYLDGTDLELIVVPHGKSVTESELSVEVNSTKLKDYIEKQTIKITDEKKVVTQTQNQTQTQDQTQTQNQTQDTNQQVQN